MPATVSPSFKFSGVATSLGKKLVAPSTSFSATLDSIAGVNTVVWSIVGTDETTEAGNYSLTPSGTKGETVTFTSGAVGTGGILSCTVNSGVDPQTGSRNDTMTATAKWYVALTDGGEVGCVNETTESDPEFGSTGVINGIARRLADASARGTITTEDDTETTILEIPFGDDAVAMGTVSVIALANPGGLYSKSSIGGVIGTNSGVLFTAGTSTDNEFWSESPDPSPSFTVEYYAPSEMLRVKVTGLPAVPFVWVARLDIIMIIA